MNEYSDSGTDFTEKAWDALYDAVDAEEFLNSDAEVIYDALYKRLRFIPFGDYLKRYIYRRAGLAEPFAAVELDVYRRIIRDSFKENYTPASFEPTTAKLSALSKNWLTQQTVNRKVVFLLGFGLRMSAADVEDFLTKALRERGFNAKDPFEIICWYCFKNGYGFYKFEALWEAYLKAEPGNANVSLLFGDLTVSVRNSVMDLTGDAALLSFVSKLKTKENRPKLSVSARRCFDGLFAESKRIAADILTREEKERVRIEAARYESRLLNDPRVSDAERNERISRLKSSYRTYLPDEITESDLEHIISSAIPVDRHGNLTPAKASALNEQFEGKRFSRQHVSEILADRTEVTRFDIITLNFFIFSQSLGLHPNSKERYSSFIKSSNEMLTGCFMGELNISNPYECFVLMCLLSEDPLGTYADVWELSYSGDD